MIKKLDHLVITATDILATLDFYNKLGFKIKADGGRYEIYGGDFKINIHIQGKELSPYAQNVTPGSADLCFETDGSVDSLKKELEDKGILIELGVVLRKGARGAINSIYLRDPDGNLIEFCSYE